MAGVGLSGGVDPERIDVVMSVPGILVERDDLEITDRNAVGDPVEPAASGMEGGLSIGEAEVLVGAPVDPPGDRDESEQPEGMQWGDGADELEGACGEDDCEGEDSEGGFLVGPAYGARGDLSPVPGEGVQVIG